MLVEPLAGGIHAALLARPSTIGTENPVVAVLGAGVMGAQIAAHLAAAGAALALEIGVAEPVLFVLLLLLVVAAVASSN